MAKRYVADYILERLRAWDVRHVFAYPGDGINGILGAWGRAENRPMFVQGRHEEMSAFEAVGYAKFTGRVGVCMATSGPGAIHLLNGLYDAKLDHVPVVAIVGQTNRSAMGGSYQQEVDLLSLYKDVASDYVQMVTVPEQLPNVLDRAIRVAMTQRTPTALIIPADVQELPYSPPTHAFKMVPSSLGIEWPVVSPDDAAIVRAAELLNNGSRVAMLVGAGARGAHQELSEVADLLGAGAAKALLGKDVLSDELPWVRPVVAFAGDGAMQMNGMAELITVKRYWHEWDDPRLIVAILHNDDLNQVTWEMRAMGGAPKFVESQSLPDVDYASFAAGLGLNALSSETPTNSPTLGATRCQPIARLCWMSIPTPTCHPSRHTPPGSNSRPPLGQCSPATRTAPASSKKGSRPKPRSFCHTKTVDRSSDRIGGPVTRRAMNFGIRGWCNCGLGYRFRYLA